MNKKGNKKTEEHKKRISLAHKGKILKESTKEKLRKLNIGKTLSKESIRKRNLSRENFKHSENTKQKIRNSLRGHSVSKETKKKISQRLIEVGYISPKKDTSIELKIQDYLKQLGFDFFTHVHMNEIKHSYRCDILVPKLNLIIECDGDFWHKYPIGREIDKIRTNELIEQGFKVLRLWESEIKQISLNKFKQRLEQ